MTTCRKCGAPNADCYSTCLGCGESLPDAPPVAPTMGPPKVYVPKPRTHCAACGSKLAADPCQVCGQPRIPRRADSPARYSFVEMMATCSSCGYPLPINGPLEVSICPTCQSKITHPSEGWSSLFATIDENHWQLLPSKKKNYHPSDKTTVVYGPGVPACPSCGCLQAVGYIPVGTDQEIQCGACKQPWTTFPAPAWLRELFPNLEQFYAAERSFEESGKAEISDSAKPITFQCPDCQGALRITSKDSRTMTCSYCDAAVFLPDALWLRLHPVKTKQRWYFRCGGRSR